MYRETKKSTYHVPSSEGPLSEITTSIQVNSESILMKTLKIISLVCFSPVYT